MSARVTIVTSGHPSSCPRMLKAADAAVDAGYAVRLVSVDYISWAAHLDTELVTHRGWRWRPVPLSRAKHPLASRWVSARQRAARQLAARALPGTVPMSVAVRAYARVHPELVAAILSESFDFVYGGTVGALAATAEAARRARRPYALDFEDYHPGESEESDAELTHRLAHRVIRAAHCGASFLTTSSVPIARKYDADLEARTLVIHNAVPLPEAPDTVEVPPGPLKLYWFSQTVGPRRGLDDIVAGVAAAGIEVELHLRGAGGEAYVETLRRAGRDLGARISIVLHPPGPPDQMVALCREHAIGLSPEPPAVLNHELCVSNKVLTYLAAGLAVIATDTSGHQSVAEQCSRAIALYRAGDVQGVARILQRWNHDRAQLMEARRASWRAAQQRFHWEHPCERGALLAAMAQAMS